MDCGGRICARCGAGSKCNDNSDCETFACSGGLCVGRREEATLSFLEAYLSSEFYTSSFVHHLVHGDMDGASYLNPYPIMAASFCDSVGVISGVLDCSLIDFDSLLLGGCYCHPCLPENPCLAGGTCVRFERQGYSCNCSSSNSSGDHCQVDASGARDPSFVWLALPPPALPIETLTGGCADAFGGSRVVRTMSGLTANAPGSVLQGARSLAWNPEVPTELWLSNSASDSIVVVSVGMSSSGPYVDEAHHLRDRARYHYMDSISAIAFGPDGAFATCQESMNAYEGSMPPNFFMGPTLYNRSIAMVNSKQQPCAPGGHVLHDTHRHAARGAALHGYGPRRRCDDGGGGRAVPQHVLGV